MTNKEAIEEMHSIVPDRVERAQAISIAITAITKMVPKKPIKVHKTMQYCPVCERRLRSGNGSSSRGRDYFCQKCGQKIDWSDNNESD